MIALKRFFTDFGIMSPSTSIVWLSFGIIRSESYRYNMSAEEASIVTFPPDMRS